MDYPDQKIIATFIALIKERGGFLVDLLPSTSDYWVECMADMVEACRLRVTFGNIDEEAISRFAAALFLKIIMNHEMTDGNKRSAVILAYLFFILNNKDEKIYQVDPWKLRDFAKYVIVEIESGGSSYQETENNLQKMFATLFD